MSSSAALQAMPPRKRLRTKTPPPRREQLPLFGALDLADEADPKKRLSVYLVTLPHPKRATSAGGRPLVCPGSKTRQQILDMFLDCCAHPVYKDGCSIQAGEPIPVELAGVFRELHAEDESQVAHPHDHLPVRGRQFMFMPVKRALLERHGLASHWSRTHSGYWSAIRYLYMPSVKKPLASLDANYVLWAKPPMSHPALDECRNEPTTAAAIQGRRTKADREAAEQGKPAPRISEIDFCPIVVRHGMRNSPDDMTADQALMAWAVDHASTPMRDWLFKNSDRLNQLIDKIWKWEHVKENLASARLSRLQALEEAWRKPCVCQREWPRYVRRTFVANNINVAELCRDILASLEQGRNESLPVVTLAGARGGEGKSFFLKPLFSVYGSEHVFIKPGGKGGGFPLIDLPGKKVAFLDEWRFDDAVVPYAEQCLWLDGSAVTINRAQNIAGQTGHVQYRGTAPIFVTTKLPDLQRLAWYAADDPWTQAPRCAEASMIYRRLKVYCFDQRVPKPPQKTPFCGHCFAHMVLQGGAYPPGT